MGLKLKVKINSVSDLTNARTFAGFGVDYIGFIPQTEADNQDLEATKSLSLSHFKQIKNWVNGPVFVLETHGLPLDKELASQLISDFEPDLVEVNTSNVCLILTCVPREKIIFKIKPDKLRNYNLYRKANFYAVIFDFSDRKNPEIIDWLHTTEVLDPYMITGLSDGSTINDLLKSLPQMGLCLDAIAETQPGLANLESVIEVLEFLEE